MNATGAIRILGIDPGSRMTGFGVIDSHGDVRRLIAAGTIRTVAESDLALRLKTIYTELLAVMHAHQPTIVAIEQVFVARSADSALKLGHARGIALLAAANEDLPIVEYATRRVKQTVTGSGSASKEQVQRMVKLLLGTSRSLQADAADALAVAICHAHSSHPSVDVAMPWRRLAKRRRWTRLPSS